jgi:hypothetical protein
MRPLSTRLDPEAKVSRSRSASSTLAASLVTGAALGILFLALFVATSSGAMHDLVRRPDALPAMILLMLNLSGLFTCAAFATAASQAEDVRRSRD